MKTKHQLKPSRESVKEKVFTAPLLTIQGAIVSLCFADAFSLQKSLARPHHFYEEAVLKGPLRGVNFPCIVYTDWIASLGEEQASSEEIAVHALLNPSIDESIPSSLDPLYIIAFIKGDTSTQTHELAHAYFYINPNYAMLCTEQYTTLTPSIRQYIEKELKIRGYDKSNWIDEFQAYILEGPGELGKKFIYELGMVHRALKDAIRTIV